MDDNFADLNNWNYYPEEQFWTSIPRDANVSLIDGGGVRLTATNILEEETGLYPAAQIYTKLEYLYGFFEVRCKMPLGSQGVWACPWLWPDAGVWDLVKPEIDIMEYFGGVNNYEYGSFVNHIKEGANYVAGKDLTADYHYYAIEWTATDITFFFDDYAFHVNTEKLSNVPMSVLLWNGVAGSPFAGDPYLFDVDYVRIWTRL